ncbi:MAG: MFS transporter [Spirochaetales bacterium]|nr:MAG: MFS transporter [Spirochaetales bacterium]
MSNQITEYLIMPKLKLKRMDYAGALGMFVYASSVVVTPIVLLKLAQDLSFGLAEGGGIEAVRTSFLLAVLLASGAAAIRFGKSRTLGVGSFVLAAGLLAYAFAPTYIVVLAAIILVGVGGGILEALINPLVQDEHPTDSGRYLNFINAFFSIGVLVSVLVVGDLLTRSVSWRLLIAGVGVVALASAILFVAFGRGTDHHSGARPSAEGKSSWHHARSILREPLFWLFSAAIFCGGGAEGAFTVWSASYIQIHFETLARAGALGTAAFAGGMVVGRLASGRFVGQDGLRVLIIVSAIIGVVASVGAWAVDNMIGFFAIVFAAGPSIACFWPSIQSHAAARLPVDSTMLFMLLSCAGIPGFGLTSWIMGLIAEGYSLRASLLVVPVMLAALTVVMILSTEVSKRSTTH